MFVVIVVAVVAIVVVVVVVVVVGGVTAVVRSSCRWRSNSRSSCRSCRWRSNSRSSRRSCRWRSNAASKQESVVNSSSGATPSSSQVMTDELEENINISFEVTRPTWDWYTDEVTSVKTPIDGLRATVKNSNGGWVSQLTAIISHSMTDIETLKTLGLSNTLGADRERQDAIASKVVSLMSHLLTYRAWSLVICNDSPPDCYADLLTSSAPRRDAAMERMRADWRQICLLEQVALTSPSAAALLEELQFILTPPVRLLFMFFERDRWDVASTAGIKQLRGMLATLPDNKLVEDIHNSIRLDSRANGNKKQKLAHMQEVVINSNAFSSREVPEPCAVTKECFVQHYHNKASSSEAVIWRVHASSHKMPVEYTSIMGNRTWKSPTPETSRGAHSAWALMRTFTGPREGGGSPANAWLSQLVKPNVVVENDAGKLLASFGGAAFGALGWPIVCVGQVGDDADARVFTYSTEVLIVWFHVTQTHAWHVIPTVAMCPKSLTQACPTAGFQGIALKQTGPPIGLVMFALSVKIGLTFVQLQALAAHLKLDCNARASRAELISAIALAVCGGEAFARKACAVDVAASHDPICAMAADPTIEAAFEDMDADDQLEFGDLKKALKRQKDKGRVLSWQRARDELLLAKAKKAHYHHCRQFNAICYYSCLPL